MPEQGTWGDHPPLPDALEQAIAARQNGGSVESAIRILEQDGADPIARSTARLFRTIISREKADLTSRPLAILIRKTLNKGDETRIERPRSLMFRGAESTARNYSVFPWRGIPE